MDLSTLTPQQRACVEHVAGPLLVSAGAGSGKTFMLTQRIAYALLNPHVSGLTDIDQVLAITFTEAAAAEIKARVRNKLREEGLGSQALKVDACWISTIHGMCSRILHENALELGLDPAFGLIDDVAKDEMLTECVQEAVAASGGALDALFDEYDRNDAKDMVFRLVREAGNVRGGLASVTVAPVADPRELAREVQEAIIAVDAVGRQDVNAKGKQGTIAPKIRDMAEGDYGWRTFERLAAKEGLTHAEVLSAVSCVPTTLYSGSKEPFATAVAAFRQALLGVAAEAQMGIAAPARAALLEAARQTRGLYERRKAALGVLDQDDLINRTLDAFEHVPAVEERYRDRFKLIMVDEFQDTSELQIALISHLTAGDTHLCTVGDTQQSIYRFRGADVATYLEHKRHMRDLQATGGLVCELDKNFRSHGDIIRFVNRLFGQERVFGDSEFIKLGFDEGHADNPRNAFPEVPRVEVLATSSAMRSGVSSSDRVAFEARAVADRLARLHATGSPNCRWADMVILLGRMSNAEVYAQALRELGAPCTVTGGSGFKDTPEAQGVAALCAALANPLDNQAMGEVLAGGLFGLGTDELLGLATSPEGKRRDFWRGMRALADEDRDGATGGPAASPRARLAAGVVRHAVTRLDSAALSEAIGEAAVESGYLARLQGQGPQGMAQAANFLKALRMVEGIEADDPATGPAQVAALYGQALEGGVKERPGSLNTDEQDAVRILTIHSSKGLEYPVVALADFNGAGGRPGWLATECAGGRLYLSLAPRYSKPDVKAISALTDNMVARLEEAGLYEQPAALNDEGLSAAKMADAIKAHHNAEELAERRRKFYVGATRPREALIVAVNYADSSSQTGNDDCINDLRCCLFGQDCAFHSVPEGVDYGGTTPAVVTHAELVLDADGRVAVKGTGQAAEEQGEGANGTGSPAAAPCDPSLADTSTNRGLPTEAAGAAGQAPRVTCASLGAAGATPERVPVPEAPRPGEFASDLEPARLPFDPAHAATFSYSSLAAHDDAAAQEDREGGTPGPSGEGAAPHAGDIHAARDSQAPGEACAAENTGQETPGAAPHAGGAPRHASATAFGSALHQACQAMAEDLAWRKAQDENDARFAPPSQERLRACLATWGVPTGELAALNQACSLWLASDAAEQAAAFGTLVPEAPFYATLQGAQGEPVHLEGAMDLLCCDARTHQGGTRRAFIADYKTGGSPAETREELQVKHDLQARCYAYVALSQGFDEVELAFVRVEQPDAARPGKPQEVRYRFAKPDLQDLHEHIRAKYAQR